MYLPEGIASMGNKLIRCHVSGSAGRGDGRLRAGTVVQRAQRGGLAAAQVERDGAGFDAFASYEKRRLYEGAYVLLPYSGNAYKKT